MAKERYFRLRHPNHKPSRRRRGGLLFEGDEPKKIPPRIKREALEAIERDLELVEVMNTSRKDEKPRWKLVSAATPTSEEPEKE